MSATLNARALTVRQPWASLIVEGRKDIENRSWPTSYRGRLLIHAGSQIDPQTGWRAEDLPRGAIIGEVALVDVVTNSRSRWALPGQYHWVLRDARPLRRPIPCAGRLGLWPAPPKSPSKR